MKKDHNYFMKKAFEEANYAFYKDEVPVGCVIVYENEIISKSSNMVELLNDSTAHAELIAITSAQNFLNTKNLNKCILYCTLEPCLMCFGACIHARIDRLIFATEDQKSGVVINNLNLKKEDFFNHKISISSGILATESSDLLKKFFQERRN